MSEAKLRQLEIDWPKCEREWYLKEVSFPKGLKIDHSKLAAVMNRIASFHGQPLGCYESVSAFMKLFKLSEDQVERSFAALRKLNLLLERDAPEWLNGRKIHPRWINFDELKQMVQRQSNASSSVGKTPSKPSESNSARHTYQPRTESTGTPHGERRNPARQTEEPRTQMRADNSVLKETPPHNTWNEVEESLKELGVLKYVEAARSAHQRGCSLEHCMDLISHYRQRLASNQHGWQAPAYVLLRRFQSASPRVAVADGWFGSGPRSTNAIAIQLVASQQRFQKTREVMARSRVPEHERAKPTMAEEYEKIMSERR